MLKLGKMKLPGSAVVFDNASLTSALNNGETNVKYLASQEFTLPTLKAGTNIEIVGASENAVVNIVASNANNSNVTIKNIKVNAITVSTNAKGWHSELLVGAKAVTFENCEFTGTYTTYAQTTFKNCTFYQDVYEYSIYFYWGNNHVVENCTFNSKGKMIKLYHEGNSTINVTVEGCKFNSVENDKYKAGIEVDSTYTTYYLYANNNKVDGVYITKVANADAGEDANAYIYVDGVQI